MPSASPEELRAMTAWYRGWADVADSEVEREHRLAQAACLERMACEREQTLPTVADPLPP